MLSSASFGEDLQNLELTLNFALFDRLQDLDYYLGREMEGECIVR